MALALAMWSGTIELLMLVGALGLLMHGMRSMSQGLQRLAGAGLRKVMQAMTASPLMGVATGFITTVLVQLSSVTSVMTVSFVNAGLLPLRGAIPVLMGAHIGTTVKALLYSAAGFAGEAVHAFALPVAAVALPLLLLKDRRSRAMGEFLMGGAVLLVALGFMRMAAPDAAALVALNGWTDGGPLSVLLLVLLGALFTVLVQSSSVALAAVMVLCEGGVIGYELAAAAVLGMNVGTTATANIAALVGNVWARRAACVHFVIQFIGLLWALPLLRPYLALIDSGVTWVHGASPRTDPLMIAWALTYLHISFNVLNTLLQIGFLGALERLVVWLVPARARGDEQPRLHYIDDPVMGLSPQLSLLEARREILRFGRITAEMSGLMRQLLLAREETERRALLDKLAHHEETTDRMQLEVGRYLTRTSAELRDEAASVRIRAMLSIIGDLERVGDIFYQMSRVVERKNDERLWFTPEQRNDLLGMIDLLDTAFGVMLHNLEAADGAVDISRAHAVEHRIDRMRDQLRRSHLRSIEAGVYNVKSGLVYNDLFSSCEKVGDHLINVSEALVNEV